MERLLNIILQRIEDNAFSYQTYLDLYGMSKEARKEESTRQLGVTYLKALSTLCEKSIRDTEISDDDLRDIFSLHKRVCLALAPYDFDSYLLYVEWNRPPDKKFYPPRRRVLKQVVDCLQELADDKLDLLSISLPPGSGKTTLAIFFLTWLAGKIPNEPMLTGSHSNSFVRGVYDEVLFV